MTSAVADLTVHACLGCSQTDHHPKSHILVGRSIFTPGDPAKWVSLHHDCLGDPTDQLSDVVAKWRDQIYGDASGEGERVRAIRDRATAGIHGHELRAFIEQSVPLLGNGPTLATTGFDVAQGEALLNAWHINSATATLGAKTITAPINIRAMSANGADDNHTGTEITTGNSYTSGGTGLGSPTWGTATIISNIASLTTITAALNKTNMPARTIVGLEEWDSSGTPQRGWWGTVTTLTTNSGDTVSIAIGGLIDTQA